LRFHPPAEVARQEKQEGEKLAQIDALYFWKLAADLIG
jgi:hypothetical protein